MDEVWYAGGNANHSNTSYYLNSNSVYWTMTPHSFTGSNYLGFHGYVFYVWSDGELSNNGVHMSWGVRPVINLKADVYLTGSGTTSDPYRVN